MEGARYLLSRQERGGRWAPGDYETSLALLFLVRGTYPPIKGRAQAAVTRREQLPDVTTQAGLERAFFQYVEFKAGAARRPAGGVSQGGPRAVGLSIRQLRHKRQPVREAAAGLLDGMLAKPLEFRSRRAGGGARGDAALRSTPTGSARAASCAGMPTRSAFANAPRRCTRAARARKVLP